MPSPQNFLRALTRYSVLIVLSACLSGLAFAQAPLATKEPAVENPATLDKTPPADVSPAKKPEAETAKADVPPATNTDVGTAKAVPAAKAKPPAPPFACARTVTADVVAIPQPIMLNRIGAAVPDGLIFALKGDTEQGLSSLTLKAYKRPRPIVLRANVGDCLSITLTNAIPIPAFGTTINPGASIKTTEVSLHVQGLEWANGGGDDGTFAGRNNSSLATASPTPTPAPMPPQTQTYTLFAREEGTFLLYTMGDSTVQQGLQIMRGLFGAVNVEPAGAEWYRSQVTAEDLVRATYNANSLPPNATLSACNAQNVCTLTITGPNARTIKVIKTSTGALNTEDNHPLVNYDAVGSNGKPILKMLDGTKIVHSDLTAIITGPNAGRFPGTTGVNNPEPPCDSNRDHTVGPNFDPLFCQNPASPDRKQPYREVTIIYHEAMNAVTQQAFPIFTDDATTRNLLAGGKDAFAINYGTGGISAEIYANRIGVGPMAPCVDCKFEEFFLSAWPVGDPAMLVDFPGNSTPPASQAANSNRLDIQPSGANGLNFAPPCNTTTAFTTNPICGNQRTPVPSGPAGSYTMKPTVKATLARYPDDPSNVYHSYINDHLKFRILHGGLGVSHVHHQHAHQWLQSPNSDTSSYLDSQMISPGASYTLEMVYNGSGNRNKVVGDSIFHCHFYPHFASGMWAMWRTHDTFEGGTFVFPSGPKEGQVVPGARGLPDGEISTGVPTPAVVPLPTLPMAPLPDYIQIQNNVAVNGTTINYGGQVVHGGTCDNNKIKGTNLQVVGGCANNSQVTGTVINSHFDGTMVAGQLQPHPMKNPGFPYFIPGIAGARAPHPPLDFATQGGVALDGGLPRHVISGGSVKYESHSTYDWSKDFLAVNATQLPEVGTAAELAAMSFFGQRCHPTAFADGTAADCSTPTKGFILNGLPRKNPAGNAAEKLGATPGAPFADPAVDDNGNAVGTVRRYQGAAIQLNLVFNKAALGWHYPQARMLALWKDVAPTINFSFGKTPARPPEPMFFRGNSGDIIEYWHTNLVPNYYIVDDFQVRTPTDILGQHIHLVKFDVTSSDGAGNGFNYEDGTFSPTEVQELHDAVTATGGSWTPCAGCAPLRNPQPPPADICSGPGTLPPQCTNGSWNGAQTTIQRWYIDPLQDNQGTDRTMRTVFTHDHFGPSTHQQGGLYAGLLIEPAGSTWTSNDGTETFGSRSDGGPTSWQARIITQNRDDSYREFMLEFQDFMLAYQVNKLPNTPAPKFPSATSNPDPDKSKGYRDFAYAVGAPEGGNPQIISTGTIGSQSVNYRNEPVPWRAQILTPGKADLSNAFDSDIPGVLKGDPFTPLMRAYQGDKVQIRMLVGAHQYAHQFNFGGPTWLAEPSWKNSGYRSAQPMGLSEHFELLFNVPYTSRVNRTNQPLKKCPDNLSDGFCVDYLYSPSFDETGIANGLWGLFRSYDPTMKLKVDPANGLKGLEELPNNPINSSNAVNYQTCPAGATQRTYKLTAVTAQKALAGIAKYKTPEDPNKGQIVFNDRGDNPVNFLRARLGILYVRDEDLDSNGKLKPGVPVEPIVLRANAGDCINIELKNAVNPNSDLFTQSFPYRQPLTGPMAPAFTPGFASQLVGLYPQLVAYDATNSTGLNVGYNRLVTGDSTQIVKFSSAANPTFPALQKYQWFAGKIERDGRTANMKHTAVELGSGNLFPSDPLFQNINGLFGQIIIEPANSTWNCGEAGSVTNCYPAAGATSPTTRTSATVTPQSGTPFREFSTMISDSIRISQGNSSAVNYGTEPANYRFSGNTGGDLSCNLSNVLVRNPAFTKPADKEGEPKTPIFTADIGQRVRFHMTHPFGTGTSQVFTVSGHIWQRNPFTQESTVIGNNSLTQWMGSRDNHGSSDHFELLIDKAGGEQGKRGDYLYGVYLRDQITLGAWGLFRVGQTLPDPGPNAACPKSAAPTYQPPTQEDKDLKQFKRQPAATDPRP
jgi:manganese oxidase